MLKGKQYFLFHMDFTKNKKKSNSTSYSFTREPRSNSLEEAGGVVGLEEGEDHSRAFPVLGAEEASSGSPWS